LSENHNLFITKGIRISGNKIDWSHITFGYKFSYERIRF